MIIDGHAHACGEYLTYETITQTLNANQVDKVILVPGELNSNTTYSLPNLAERFPKINVVKWTNVATRMVISIKKTYKQIEKGNEYVYSLVNKNPNRIFQFYWATSYFQDIISRLNETFEKWQYKGIKVHQCWDPFTIDSTFFTEIASWAINKKLPLFIHLRNDKEVKKLIQYKLVNPELKLIIGHLFGMEHFIPRKSEMLNVYFDTSTFQIVSDFRVEKCIQKFGSEFIFYGTDVPYGKDNTALNKERIMQLDIPDSAKEDILGKNMARLIFD